MSAPAQTVLLLGFDFGSTTCSAMAAYARLEANCVTGRMEFARPDVFYRSTPCFTPFSTSTQLDIAAIEHLIDAWLAESGVAPEAVFSGGAIVTGLAAERDNARALTHSIETRIGDTVIATARDPALESWLAFMGGCDMLSHLHEGGVLNLDIGGGTTNPALGAGGQVLATGCHFIGARHFQFAPDGQILSGLSSFGDALLAHLGLSCRVGARMEERAIAQVVAYYIQGLEAIAQGQRGPFADPCGAMHEQVAFAPAMPHPPLITFSGGVGEMVYAAMDGHPLPPRSLYGDLGTDIAQGILSSPLLSRDLGRGMPENRGRATVYGLTMHSTDISGTTIFMPRSPALPLRDLPVLATLDMAATADRLTALLTLAARHPEGACLRLDDATPPTLAVLRQFGAHLAEAIERAALPQTLPLVLLTTRNIGHTLGNYATRWGTLPCTLVVLDEVPARNARFIRVGRPHNAVLPVSFYGMN